MTATAITFLVLSVLVVWGGLALSIVRLRRDGEELETGDGDVADGGPGPGGDLR